MFVAQFGSGAEEVKPFPVANPGLELDAKQVRKSEDGLRAGVLSNSLQNRKGRKLEPLPNQLFK